LLSRCSGDGPVAQTSGLVSFTDYVGDLFMSPLPIREARICQNRPGSVQAPRHIPLYSPCNPPVIPLYSPSIAIEGDYRGSRGGIQGVYRGYTGGYADGLGLGLGGFGIWEAGRGVLTVLGEIALNVAFLAPSDVRGAVGAPRPTKREDMLGDNPVPITLK
jgi:hypothetical protein